MRDFLLHLIAVAAASGCVTTRPDAVGAGDSRLDDASRPETVAIARGGTACGNDAASDLVLLDARTGGPLTCTTVTVSAEGTCADCPAEVLFKGATNRRGQLGLSRAVQGAVLTAVAEGYAPSQLGSATTGSKVLELEMIPEDGFWLKVVDADGNYLPDVLVTFRQGGDVVAQLRSNSLANVFFAQRSPFAGQPASAEADGYGKVTIAGLGDLGSDGHTLTFRK